MPPYGSGDRCDVSSMEALEARASQCALPPMTTVIDAVSASGSDGKWMNWGVTDARRTIISCPGYCDINVVEITTLGTTGSLLSLFSLSFTRFACAVQFLPDIAYPSVERSAVWSFESLFQRQYFARSRPLPVLTKPGGSVAIPFVDSLSSLSPLCLGKNIQAVLLSFIIHSSIPLASERLIHSHSPASLGCLVLLRRLSTRHKYQDYHHHDLLLHHHHHLLLLLRRPGTVER